jgi:hypothetical protein
MSIPKRVGVGVLSLCFATAPAALAQSTFGVILGNVTDASGALVKGAKVRVTQTAENASREGESNGEGAYEFQNMEAGPYLVTVAAPGFRTFSGGVVPGAPACASMPARSRRRVANCRSLLSAGVIATDTPTISSNSTAEKVLNSSNVRGAGSTAPMPCCNRCPAFRPITVSVSLIQEDCPRNPSPPWTASPSPPPPATARTATCFSSVDPSPKCVQGVGNTAEFGQPGDITVISKSGANQYHGALFWYHQNKALTLVHRPESAARQNR